MTWNRGVGITLFPYNCITIKNKINNSNKLYTDREFNIGISLFKDMFIVIGLFFGSGILRRALSKFGSLRTVPLESLDSLCGESVLEWCPALCIC